MGRRRTGSVWRGIFGGEIEGTYGDPEDGVRVDGEAGAAAVLLVAEGVDHYGIFEGACNFGVKK